MNREILGYREQPLATESEDNELAYDYHSRSYRFSPVRESRPGMIATASLMMCQECGHIIKNMGGPGYRCFCVKCYEALKVADFAQGHEHTVSE